jgi:hypothetical protein
MPMRVTADCFDGRGLKSNDVSEFGRGATWCRLSAVDNAVTCDRRRVYRVQYMVFLELSIGRRVGCVVC